MEQKKKKKRFNQEFKDSAVRLVEIRDIMKDSRQTYGIKRVTQALKERGFLVNHRRVERLMREVNIRCKKVKRFKKTTNSNHKYPASGVWNSLVLNSKRFESNVAIFYR